MSPARRLPGLDGLRGLAALAIVVLHVWMYTGANDRREPRLLDMALGELRLGVPLFFVLSGYLLAGPWVAAALGGRPVPDARRFLARRLARVAPGYWVAVAGSVAVLWGTGHPRAAALHDLPLFALFAQNYFPQTAGHLDPPMWSLGIEVAFYAVLPVLGWGLVRARRRAAALAGCAALAGLGLAWTALGVRRGWPATTMVSLPTYLPVFACGISAAVLAHGRRPGRAAAGALLLAGASLVAADSLWHVDGTGFAGHVVRDLPAAAGLAAIVAAVSLRPAGVLSVAPLRFLGTISYGVYLWHLPVLLWLRTRGQFPHEPPGALAAVLLPTLAIATASWYLVERPCLRLHRRRARAWRREPAPAQAS
jgi:peptidoglycan/LPS O-acetylase OafA/YrhL